MVIFGSKDLSLKSPQEPSPSAPADPASWVDLHADYLYRYALAKTGRPETAEDLVQDTFLSAIRALEGFRGDSSERTWLTRILHNKIIDYYRRKPETRERPFSAWFFGEGGHWEQHALPSDSGAFSGDLEKKEFMQMLQHCLSLLPGNWRLAFSMKHMDDLDAGEICKELGLSTSNYWVIMHRARLHLRECLEKSWNGNNG
jgi:RNA polymerase sigma-70 factor (TIGR02943 family)